MNYQITKGLTAPEPRAPRRSSLPRLEPSGRPGHPEQSEDLHKEIALLREANSILMEQAGAARERAMKACNERDFVKRERDRLQEQLDSLRKDGLAF